jgi:hypothetical protein
MATVIGKEPGICRRLVKGFPVGIGYNVVMLSIQFLKKVFSHVLPRPKVASGAGETACVSGLEREADNIQHTG